MKRRRSSYRAPMSHRSGRAAHSTKACGYSRHYRRGREVSRHRSTKPRRAPSPPRPRRHVQNPRGPDRHTPVQDITSCRELVYGAYLGNETRHLEFKRGGFCYLHRTFCRDALMYGCAFLNSGGGSLLVGVCDDGVVCGVRFNHRKKDRTLLQVDCTAKLFDPPLFPHNYLLRFLPVMKAGDHRLMVLCLTFKAPPGANLYHVNRGQVYLRQDGSVWGPLSSEHTRELRRQVRDAFAALYIGEGYRLTGCCVLQRRALQAGQAGRPWLAGHLRWLQETLGDLQKTAASLRRMNTARSERWSSRLRKDTLSLLERLCLQIRECKEVGKKTLRPRVCHDNPFGSHEAARKKTAK
ncbi:uncharacterized protein AB9W97_001072 [Spinachia spinachia]